MQRDNPDNELDELDLHDVAHDLHHALALGLDLGNTKSEKERELGAMRKQDAGFDFDRYRKLLAEAVDEPKRLALINLLVDEKAKDSLAAQSRLGLIRSVLSAPPKPSTDD